jgi:transcription initiation factor TFIIE subunit alpha
VNVFLAANYLINSLINKGLSRLIIMEQGMLTEIPSYLKQLARLVARGFFQIEDSLIVDMLVRNPCKSIKRFTNCKIVVLIVLICFSLGMKEKEIEELLKFDTKLLRSRLATLKNEKFLQTRLRMETGPDGKAQKVNYYFINYKILVNVIKYKLDHMRKKMETQERDATNRASFKCTNCFKTFTGLFLHSRLYAILLL